MSYMVDKSPAEDKLLQRQIRPWEPKDHQPVLTASRSAFKTFNTYGILAYIMGETANVS